MKIMNYSDWQETAWTVHMVLQFMGKLMLDKVPNQPEWNHALLRSTSGGFTTGLIPNQDKSFDVSLHIQAGEVQARCTDGQSASFVLDGRSISDYYQDFQQILQQIGVSAEICPKPQEVFDTTPFQEQTQPLQYHPEQALQYFQMAVFAQNALLKFAAPFRGKKILPSLFWGTFDMTTVLFSGQERPFPGSGIIEKTAFDEKFVEFGFWPGDNEEDRPMFFVLPYPFVEKDYSQLVTLPKGCYYDHSKKEFFLPLQEALEAEDPEDHVIAFCDHAFKTVTRNENWDDLEWLMKPLYNQKSSQCQPAR